MSTRCIADAIESILPKRRPIAHHEPCVNGREAAFIKTYLDQGVGNDVWAKRVENDLIRRIGVSHAVAVNSGTAALHLALLAAGVRPNDEVLVPTLTFAATANAISYCGAIPHFVDGPLSVNAYKLRCHLADITKKGENGRGRLNTKTNRVISALIVVDLLGFPADYAKLEQLADEFGLVLIEDAAQALGAINGNRMCGSFGKAAIFSFNNNKIVTGNGGGALLSNDEWLVAKAWQLATTAKVPHPYKMEHDAVGFNYRMNGLTASMIAAQLEQLDQFVVAKRAINDKYREALKGCAEVLTAQPWQGVPNNWLTTIMLQPNENRDELLTELHKRGILARALFQPLHLAPMYADCPRDDNLLSAETTAKRAVCLPSGPGLLE